MHCGGVFSLLQSQGMFPITPFQAPWSTMPTLLFSIWNVVRRLRLLLLGCLLEDFPRSMVVYWIAWMVAIKVCTR